MKMRNLLLLFVATMLLTMLFGYAVFASETIKACPQADGSVLYTNKDVKGCATVKLPPLSVVPDRKAHLDYEVPVAVIETRTAKSLAPNPVIVETCTLYSEWLRLNQRIMGGFEYSSVDDAKRLLVLTKIFGSGFSPYGCQ